MENVSTLELKGWAKYYTYVAQQQRQAQMSRGKRR